jgi:uncharacterized membrane protein YgcG
MNKRSVALGVVAALLLPILLALAAYFVSANSFAATSQAVRAPGRKIGQPRRSPAPSPSETAHDGGRCAEAEHKNDSACAKPAPSGSSDDSQKPASKESSPSGDSASGSSGRSGSNDSGSGTSGGSGSGTSGSSGSSGGDD